MPENSKKGFTGPFWRQSQGKEKEAEKILVATDKHINKDGKQANNVEGDLEIVRDHHFYENIGKYDNFFAGWLDNDEIYLYEKVSTGEKLAMSPKKRLYRNDYDKAEEYYDIAGYALSVILTNHVVSMVDALLTAKFINSSLNFVKNSSFMPFSK